VNGSDTRNDFNLGLPTDGAAREVSSMAVSSDGTLAFVGTPEGVYTRTVERPCVYPLSGSPPSTRYLGPSASTMPTFAITRLPLWVC
jgi:hypothetical protein